MSSTEFTDYHQIRDVKNKQIRRASHLKLSTMWLGWMLIIILLFIMIDRWRIEDKKEQKWHSYFTTSVGLILAFGTTALLFGITYKTNVYDYKYKSN